MRRKLKYMGTTLFILAAAVPLLCSCSRGSFSLPGFGKREPSEQMVTVLTLGTADSGGAMYPAGQALAQVIQKDSEEIKMNLSASNGSFSNIEQIMEHQIDLGLVSGDVAYDAFQGRGDFSGRKQTGLRAVGAVYLSASNWMALDTSDLTYVHDLKGQRVAVGPQNSTTDVSARIVLKLFGITPENTAIENYGLGSGAEDVLAKNLDAVHGFAGIPIPGFKSLASQVPSHLLLYTDEELTQIVEENPFYIKTVIPAGTYPGQEEDVDTFGVKCLICVNQDMEEELVYRLTSILYSSRQELASQEPPFSAMLEEGFCYSQLPIPLHDGALAFYREEGLID